MSTVLVVNSTGTFNVIQWYGGGVPTEQFLIQPGPQATVLPSSWVNSGNPNYEALLAAGSVQQITEASTAILVGSQTSQAAALSTTGSPTTIAITNIGVQPGYVALGNSSVVATTSSTLVAPGQTVVLSIGSNTYIGYLGFNAGFSLVLGS
jgi:hypothetical protein